MSGAFSSFVNNDDDGRSSGHLHQAAQPPPAFATSTPASPLRFAASSGAFGLGSSNSSSNGAPGPSGTAGGGMGLFGGNHTHSHSHSQSLSSQPHPHTLNSNHAHGHSHSHSLSHSSGSSTAVSPTSPGPTRRLRRPSLLSLAPTNQNDAMGPRSDDQPSPTAAFGSDVPSLSSGSNSPAMSTSISHQQHQGAGSFGQGHHHIGSPPALQPLPRWGTSVAPFTAITGAPVERVSSAPPIPIEGLKTSNSPVPLSTGRSADACDSGMDVSEMSSPPRWLPGHLQRRRTIGGKSNVLGGDEDAESSSSGTKSRFPGRPLHGALLATLISESAPLEHEMRSEARLQRLITSHPSALPLTPRQRRNTRGSRGRFPEMVGGDDDDDDDIPRRRLSLGARWRAASSDSDSDDMMDDEPSWPTPSAAAGAVNSAFASVMDLDRPASSGSSSAWPGRSDSGKSTPAGMRAGSAAPGSMTPNPNGFSSDSGPTPGTVTPGSQWQGQAPKSARLNIVVGASPGMGLQLPTAFGGLAMGGGGGGGTPLGSPTAEKSELGASPSAMSLASPGMMQYRDPVPIRSGKRKAAAEDRFDPYKRPRGSSPSPFQNVALSPSKPTAIPIPSSPSHAPHVGSALALGSPGYLNLGRPVKSAHPHPYTRPMSSRSRAASPALSIGSTSGVLSSSLGNGGLTGPSRPLGGPFIPTGPGASAAVNAASAPGAAPPSLGGIGFLSLTAAGMGVAEEREAEEAEDTETLLENAMEED
ncbi:uncharacterized protein LOC62_01G000523 [Vanrija pseudolonga]|uniref:Uncharacterized protein n=1 Tax=Vanrija pseudolonga TaxID=143232 RepID=A0AAF0Y2I0_9TREE|nr:hypothetical protein LOC62_01G000523 [Vanrija pseudolonga]